MEPIRISPAQQKKTLLLVVILCASTSFSQNYIFYLHGRIIEVQGANAVDQVNGYGAYKYNDILDSLKKNNTLVISEVRSKDTQVKDYALKVKKQIDSLLKKGVKPEDITVIGASKGSLIAMYVSSYLKNKSVNFVFMAACYTDDNDPEINFYGNILSIYEKSDAAGSCGTIKSHSSGVNHYKELEINTGLKHGFLYKPIREWIVPARQWAHEQYD